MQPFKFSDPKPYQARPIPTVSQVDAVIAFRNATNSDLSYSKQLIEENFGPGPIGVMRLSELIGAYYKHLLPG